MAYLTENKLANVIDIPVSLSATELKQGDWLLVASAKITQPMTLTVRYMSLQLLACNIGITHIDTSNLVYPNLGIAYLALRKDYVGGNPGSQGALESLSATDLGIFTRNINVPIILSTPGVYSWLIVNNTQASSTNTAIPPSTSIDLKLCVTGQTRLSLSQT
jgi:hypothetical protein